jgi:Lon protease (S16) C-terminal proteolytic domain
MTRSPFQSLAHFLSSPGIVLDHQKRLLALPVGSSMTEIIGVRMWHGRSGVITLLAAIIVLLLTQCRFAFAVDDSSTVEVSFAQGETELDTVKEGVNFFATAGYAVQNIPAELIGLTFTKRAGGRPVPVDINAPANSIVYIVIDSAQSQNPVPPALIEQINSSGWVTLEADTKYFSKTRKVRPLTIYKQSFSSSRHISLGPGGWSGVIVVSKSLSLKNNSSPNSPASPVPVKAQPPGPLPDSGSSDAPISGPTTNVAMPQTSIMSLEVYVQDSGMMIGRTSEVVLTATRSDKSKLVNVQFVTPIGSEMKLARDEALRFIRVAYPNWNVDKAEISFEDKYSNHDGGSIGAAVATMVLSVIQGFEIDQNVAITGDISANGKVRAIGGVSAKLHGATASKCTVAAIPLENEGQLVDAVVYNGSSLVSDIQVIGISNLNDAIATVRVDRDDKLKQAIELFGKVQKMAKDKPNYLKSEDTIALLKQVLDLVPRHLSAKILLAMAQSKQPKTLSATASQYYTAVAVRPMLIILKERADSKQAHQVPSAAVQAGLADLRKLRPMSDQNVRPLIDAWARFIEAWNSFQQGIGSNQTVQRQAQSLEDEMAKENSNADMMQKMLKEGI